MRGRPAASLNDEAKECAERMGYHWTDNTDPSVRFDGLIYRPAIMVAVRLKKVRYGLSDDCIIENKFPDDVADLRTLPLPPYIVREPLGSYPERAGLAPVLHPARHHRGDRDQHCGELPEHPLPGRVPGRRHPTG